MPLLTRLACPSPPPLPSLSYQAFLELSTKRSLTPNSKRIFVLGPSHRFYLSNCALSKCAVYDTPLGPVEVDVQGPFPSLSPLPSLRKRLTGRMRGVVVQELREKGKSLFRDLSLRQDEEEHCVEMHLPFIRKLFPCIPLLPSPCRTDGC